MCFNLVTSMASRYTDYYLRQIGRGDIGPVYRGSRVLQKGRGGFFANILRNLKPLFRSGLSAIKDQALESTAALAQDIGKKPFRQLLKDHSKMAATNLARRGIKRLRREVDGDTQQTGNGIKRRKKKSGRQSVKRIGQVGGRRKKIKKTTKKKAKKTCVKKKKKKSSKRKVASRTIDIFNK